MLVGLSVGWLVGWLVGFVGMIIIKVYIHGLKCDIFYMHVRDDFFFLRGEMRYSARGFPMVSKCKYT